MNIMSATKKILTTPLRLSLVVLLLGMLAKILEWPWATEIVLIAFVAIGNLYFVRFLKKPSKRFLDYVKMTLVFFWTANGVLKSLDFTYTMLFQIIIGASFIIWFILEGTAYFLDDDKTKENSNNKLIWNFAMVAGTLAIIIGSLLKILNWEYATYLLVLGIAIVSGYILKDVFTADHVGKDEPNNGEFQL